MTNSFKYKWHRFWAVWHETKADYYGSKRHEKQMLKHEAKAAGIAESVYTSHKENKHTQKNSHSDSSETDSNKKAQSLETAASTD